MRIKHLSLSLFLICLSVLTNKSSAQTTMPKVTVDVTQPTVTLSPYLYGLFFEDINFGADGGLYAELIQNRSFEYYPVRGEMNDKGYDLTPMTAWEKVYRNNGKGNIIVTRTLPLNKVNLNNLEMNVRNDEGFVGIANTGFDGVPLLKGESYDFSVYARREVRNRRRHKNHKFIVQLEDENGKVLDSVEIKSISSVWEKHAHIFIPSESTKNGRLVILTQGVSKVQVDMVSLFPQKTFNNRKNGLRIDLAQALKDLNPGTLRFPGGCILHGWGLDNVYSWKETLGDVVERTPNWNRWGYHQTYGLGYYEYFLLCEDLGATPLPVVPAGVSCSFTHFECVPMNKLHETVQDALDLVEFANGSMDTKYGKIRSEMGHPEPFGLKYICLGNEEGDTHEFRERMPFFAKAFHETYPDIKLIGNSGLSPNVPLYNLMDELGMWSSDEHYYEKPEWFINNQTRFDKWDRSKPKVFVGEYASLGNKLYNAVAEAIYLTGVERNADIVEMTCYAPLFARYGNTQWKRANLIWFDNESVVKTPNYHVQQLFSNNKGDVYLTNKLENWPGQEVAISTTFDKQSNDVIIKIANASGKSQDIRFAIKGTKKITGKSRSIVLQGEKDDENTLLNPERIKPTETLIKTGQNFTIHSSGMSVQVIRVKIK